MAGGKHTVKLIYGTTNKSKILFMKKRVEPLGIQILSLTDVNAPKLHIQENGNSPLENAKIKALAYYEALKMPLFSADSGLYIDGLDDARQPGINVRGQNDHMSDNDAIAYYSTLAEEMGGTMTAHYKNAICLILSPTEIHEYMGQDITSEKFLLVSKPHQKRREGFPLDSLSVDIKSGKYYYDADDYFEKYPFVNDGFRAFFKRTMFNSVTTPNAEKCIVRTADLGTLNAYKYTVIFARHKDKWLYCRAKERDTFERQQGDT